MSGKKLIEKFKEEFLLSKKYKYEVSVDDAGKTLEILLPREYAQLVRKKIPDWYKGHRTIVKYRVTNKKDEDEDEEE
jgi:hypothetical protein